MSRKEERPHSDDEPVMNVEDALENARILSQTARDYAGYVMANLAAGTLTPVEVIAARNAYETAQKVETFLSGGDIAEES